MVDAAFERADPAVEQRDGGHLLPAEVVDDERAAVGLELQRRLVDLRVVVVHQLQAVPRQLAARPDDRAAHAHPAAIMPAVQRTGVRIAGSVRDQFVL